jgi:phytoene dehydrogenase-like protein
MSHSQTASSGCAATVVGSGPNGLAAAIVLARAGWWVRVLEAQNTIGGGARTAVLTLPGFLHDRCSAIHPLAAGSPFFESLGLGQHGLEWIHPPLALAHPFDDGTAAVLARDLHVTCGGLGRDGEAWRQLFEPVVKNWQPLMKEFLQPMLHAPKHPLQLARFGLWAAAPALPLARWRFQGEHARALFCGLAAQSFLPLTAFASAAFGLVLGGAAHAVGWPMPCGGAQAISDALAKVLMAAGGMIETGRPVSDVRELGGDQAVMLDLSAWPAARVAGPVLPERYRRKLERFRHGPSVFKIDYALSSPIPWKAPDCARAGTVHLGGKAAEVALAEAEVAGGKVPGRPFVLVTQPSLFDASR